MKNYFQLLLIALTIVACSSPQKSFEKGNYEKSYKSALKNIKKGSKNRRDRTILNKSFKELLVQKSNEAETYLYSDLIEDWERGYSEYNDLLSLFYSGKVYLDDGFDMEMQNIELDMDTLERDLAINFHSLGQMSMENYEGSYDKSYAQDAYRFFEKTAEYQSGFLSIDSLMNVAYDKAVVNILVEADAPFDISYAWEIDRRFSDIEQESRGFEQISYERNIVNADCVLEMDFSRLDRFVREARSAQSFSERIEDGYETKVDTAGRTTRVPIYRTVEGSVTTISENVSYAWQVAVNAKGPRDYCDFRNRVFSAEEVIVYERYELSGDQRAIPSRFKNVRTNSNRNEDEAIDDLIDRLYREISNYYF